MYQVKLLKNLTFSKKMWIKTAPTATQANVEWQKWAKYTSVLTSIISLSISIIFTITLALLANSAITGPTILFSNFLQLSLAELWSKQQCWESQMVTPETSKRNFLQGVSLKFCVDYESVVFGTIGPINPIGFCGDFLSIPNFII